MAEEVRPDIAAGRNHAFMRNNRGAYSDLTSAKGGREGCRLFGETSTKGGWGGLNIFEQTNNDKVGGGRVAYLRRPDLVEV
jgi:hypothetical protein